MVTLLSYPPLEASVDTHLPRSTKGLLIKGLAERRRLDSDGAGRQRWAGFSALAANSLMRLRKMCAHASLQGRVRKFFAVANAVISDSPPARGEGGPSSQ